MDRRRVLVLALGAILTVSFVGVATSGGVEIAQRWPTLPWDLSRRQADETDRVETSFEPIDADGLVADDAGDPGDIPDTVAALLEFVLFACGGVLLAVLWRRRPHLRWRRQHRPGEVAAVDDLVVLLSSDAAAQRELLFVGEPRNSIVVCWLRLEALVAAAGFERDPAHTPSEFATRVLARFVVDRRSVDGLASLYREARFSSHVMGEDQRHEAVRLLDAVHAGLQVGERSVMT